MTRQSRMRWGVMVAVAVGLIAGVAQAQEDDRGIKPEVMLLIDTSGSMQTEAVPGEGGDQCRARAGDALPAIAPQGNNAPMTRLELVKSALAGTPNPPSQRMCVVEDVAIEGPIDVPALADDRVGTHSRAMCCNRQAGPACLQWLPCGDDSLAFGGDPLADPATAIRRDGLIHSNETRIKFGLATFDYRPLEVGSFGNDAVQVAANIANGADILGRGVIEPNLGIRPPPTPGDPIRPGQLIPGNRGVINDGNLRPQVVVGEDPDSVRRHNALVMDQLRGLVGRGPSPLAASLHDLGLYYDQQAEGVPGERDDAFLCRRRVAVLITDGSTSSFYGNPELDGQAGNPCVGACSREGFPYESSEAYAAALGARGIPLYVIAFGGEGEDKARTIARAAAAGEVGGAEGAEDGFFFVAENPEDLRQALGRISNSALAGLRTRTRPLVVTPGQGDVDIDENLSDVRQIRLVSFSEVPADGDGGRYGRIAALQYGCEGGQDGDEGEPGRLEFLGGVLFNEQLAAQEGRNAVGGNPGGAGVIGALGFNDALFNDDGSLNNNGELDEDALRELADAPRGEGGEGEDPLDDVVNALGGFFGDRGLVEGDDGQVERGQRQLGEIFDGDMIAIPPPQLAATNPSYRAFARDRQRRPTLIGAGARDGQIHFFRLADAREVLTFIPRLSWRNLRDGVDNPGLGALNADGPLVYSELAECRSLGDGNAQCPAEDGDIDFHTMVIGGLGGGGPNLFGINLSDATAALSEEDPIGQINANDLRAWDLVNAPELDAIEAFEDTTLQEAQLGLSISRPLLTHVRIDDEIRAVAVVGCGDDRNADRALADVVDGEGRCVLVIDAISGAVIRKFTQDDGVADGAEMDAPMVGTPAGFPAGGIQAADRVFIGDRKGRLWRVDLRDSNVDDWQMDVVWPPEDPEEARDYRLGRPVVDRPSLSLRDDGRLVVVFGTGADPQPVDGVVPEAAASVVSFTESLVLGDGDGDDLDFQTETNWVMPLRPQEYLTGPPVTHRRIVYITTVEDVDDEACANKIGRLYGVHFTRTEENPYRTEDGRELDVVPGLPTLLTEAGDRVTDAVSIRLPPGRVAHGLAVATAPACAEGQGTTTQILMNLADESQGVGGQVNAGGARAERKTGELVPGDLDRSLFDAEDMALAMDLNPTDANGNQLANPLAIPPLFPRTVVYWGSTFSR